MAKSQLRSGRQQKKPKKDNAKSSPTVPESLWRTVETQNKDLRSKKKVEHYLRSNGWHLRTRRVAPRPLFSEFTSKMAVFNYALTKLPIKCR